MYESKSLKDHDSDKAKGDHEDSWKSTYLHDGNNVFKLAFNFLVRFCLSFIQLVFLFNSIYYM